MSKAEEAAISPTRAENYAEWYQEVIKAADLAENSPVRGCMVIKPWGYGIWENMQRHFDDMIKATGHENAYFPLFIPLSFLEKEAAHVEGFAKECAVVTHHRLEVKDGRLIPAPAAQLEEPLVVRPTSETIIGESFKNWVQSYRDLPILINQWANVVRWEMRPRLFLRTTEFLWQEGHTVHENREDALKETMQILELYRSFAEDCLALPVIAGEKPVFERFPGAELTYCIEAMMQDGKALQAGTSHYLGQNFANASGIKFLNREGQLQFAHTTSWGISTRLIGGMIMTHADDNGMRVPPRVAPKHVVIVPVTPKEDSRAAVLEYADSIAAEIRAQKYEDRQIVVHVDARDIRGGDKSWQWIKKGVPLRIEVGPRDLESKSTVIFRRDKGPRDKESIGRDKIASVVPQYLSQIQSNYYAEAKAFREEKTRRDVATFEQLKEMFSGDEEGKGSFFVIAPWSEAPETEEKITPLKLTVRCMPLSEKKAEGKCIISGRPATTVAVFAKAY